MRLEWSSTRWACCIRRDCLPFTRHQVLTGRQPFHHLGLYAAVIAIQKGKRPRKPDHAESLGFSDTLWWLTRMCWSESPSARPTAQELLRYLQDASHTWVPPPHYPIPDDRDRGAELDLTSGDEQSLVTGVLTSHWFVLIVSVSWVLLHILSLLVIPLCYTDRSVALFPRPK